MMMTPEQIGAVLAKAERERAMCDEPDECAQCRVMSDLRAAVLSERARANAHAEFTESMRQAVVRAEDDLAAERARREQAERAGVNKVAWRAMKGRAERAEAQVARLTADLTRLRAGVTVLVSKFGSKTLTTETARVIGPLLDALGALLSPPTTTETPKEEA